MSETDTDLLPGLSEEEPPADNDLPGQLAAAAPRRWGNRATPALLAVALPAGGFLGGVQVQRHWGNSSATPASTTSSAGGTRTGTFPGGRASGFPAGASAGPGGGFPGGGSPGGGNTAATTGTIKKITTTALTVQTTAGATVTVKIAASTTISKATTLANLKTGQAVTVRGSTGTDGSVTATAVTAS
jgi:hypothetical protein